MPRLSTRTIALLALVVLLTSCGAAPAAPQPTAPAAAAPTSAPLVPTSLPTSAPPAPTDASAPTEAPAPGAARDPNATFLVRAGTMQSMLFSVVDGALQPQWPEPRTLVQISRWDDAGGPLEAADGNGVLAVAPDGAARYSWGATGPEISITGKSDPFLFRPDAAEIVYERDGDIYSKAALADAPEERWTTGRRFSAVTGWVDADTVTAQDPDALGGHGYIVRRDGQIVDLGVILLRPYNPSPRQIPSGLLLDPAGRTRFVARGDGSFYAIGEQGLEPLGDLTPDGDRIITGLRYLTWTGDGQALVFSNAEGGAPGQLLALSDGGLRQVGADLQIGPDGPASWAAVPGASQVAVVAGGPGGDGVYLVDAASGASRLVSGLPAARLVGVSPGWVALVVDEGAEPGGYLAPLDGGEARRVTPGPIEAASAGPDGQIWLIGSGKLWRYDPRGGAPAAEIAGGELLAAYPGAEILWPPLRLEPMAQSMAGQVVAATPTPAPLAAVPTPTEQVYVTSPGAGGFVVVWAEPSTQSRETLRLPAGTEVLCEGLVEGEEVDGSRQWAACPAIGGYILAAQLTESSAEVRDSPNSYPALVTAIRVWQSQQGLAGSIRDFCIRGGDVALARVAPSVDAEPTLLIVELNAGLWEVAHSGPYPGGVARWDAAMAACKWR